MGEWEYVETISACGQGFHTYINKALNKGKNIWFDGYEEEFELA